MSEHKDLLNNSSTKNSDKNILFPLISGVALVGSCSQILLSLHVVFLDKEFATLGLSFLLLTIFGLLYFFARKKVGRNLKFLICEILICLITFSVTLIVFFLEGIDSFTATSASLLCLAFSLSFPLASWFIF
jgi:hypothetical protein